jgi:hypothetical protein
VLMFSLDCSSSLLCRTLSSSTTANTTRLITHAALSILAGKIHKKGLREFRSHAVARQISWKTRARTGFTWRWICLQFLATKD